MSSAQLTLQDALLIQKDAEITSHWLVAGIALYLYDYCLTFQEEVRFVWSSQPSVVKTLFLINRYVMPVFMCLIAPGNGFVRLHIRTCQIMIMIIGAGVPFMFAVWNWLVGVRVLALYRDSPRLKLFIQSFWLITALGNFCLSTYQSVDLMRHAVVIDDIKFCGPTEIPKSYFVIWVPSICYETVVFTLAMRKLFALAHLKSTPLLQLLLRDGFLHYIGLTGTRLANLALYIHGDLRNIYMVFFFFLGFGSTLISRMILNLRGVDREAVHHSVLLSLEPRHPPPASRGQDSNTNRVSLSPLRFAAEVVATVPTHDSNVYFGSTTYPGTMRRDHDQSLGGFEHIEMSSTGPSRLKSTSSRSKMGNMTGRRSMDDAIGKDSVVVVIRKETESRVDYEGSNKLGV